MSKENNKMQVDIENLFKQNVNDLSSIKELYRKLKEVEEKILQFKYIDSQLANKLKKEYEKLQKIILDENIQVKLTNDIESINSQLDTKAKQLNDITLTFEMFGAVGDGVTDDTQAIQQTLDYSKLYRYRIKGNGQKRYAISSPLIVNGKCFIDLDGSEIIAINEMEYMFGGTLSSENSNNYPVLNSIRFNGNNNVKDVLNFTSLNRVYASNLFIEKFKENAINIQNGGGFYFSNSYIWGGKYNTTVGIRCNASDCMYSHIMIRDCNRAIINSRSATVYDDVHGWVESIEVLPNSTFFTQQNIENSDCRLLNCYSDTYQVSFKIGSPNNRITFNNCYTFFNETKFNQETMPNIEPILLQLGSHSSENREAYTKDLIFSNCIFRPLTYGVSNFIGVSDKSFYGKCSCNFYGNDVLKYWVGFPEDTYKTEIENGTFAVNDATITNHSLTIKKKINRINLNGFISRTTLNAESGAIYGKISSGFTPKEDLIYYAPFVGDVNSGICQVTIFKSGSVRIDNVSGVTMTNSKISLNCSYDNN